MPSTLPSSLGATPTACAQRVPIIPRLAPTMALPAIPSQQHQRLDDGTHEARVYIAGATHLRSYLKPLGITAYKIGVTGRRSTWDRIMDLRASNYAGALCNEKTHEMAPLEEANDWFQMPLQDDSIGLWELPACVTLDRNTIVLRMSTRIPVERLDDTVHLALAPRDLRRYLLGEEGQIRMSAAGYNPRSQLWTNYSLANDGRRPSAAHELYLIRPRRELRDLITCLAEVVAVLEQDLGNEASRQITTALPREL